MQWTAPLNRMAMHQYAAITPIGYKILVFSKQVLVAHRFCKPGNELRAAIAGACVVALVQHPLHQPFGVAQQAGVIVARADQLNAER